MTRCVCPAAGLCRTHRRPTDPPEGRRMSETRHRQCRDEPGYYEAFANDARQDGPRGLGDVVAAVTQATGIKAAVDAVAGALGVDCGCEKRREALNRAVPFRRP